MKRMAVYALLGAVLLSACEFPRPDAAAACTSAADCPDLSTPFCVDHTCVAGCASNADCAGNTAGALCQTQTGTCVSCLDNTMCAADKPVCDPSAGSCRGCTADGECTSGVCLEADGTCAAEGDVLYVADGALDTGSCTRSSPCGTIAYALTKVTSTRNVLSLGAGNQLPSAVIAIDRAVYVDGRGAVIHRAGPVMSVAANIAVTVANVTLRADNAAMPAVATVGNAASLRLYGAQVFGELQGNTGTLSVLRSTIASPTTDTIDGVSCNGGTLLVSASKLEHARVSSVGCQLTVERNRFEMFDGSVSVNGGSIRIENNLIENSVAGTDSMGALSVASGSAIRFNTFVNTSGTPLDGVALNTDSTVTVTSNIFAYNSPTPRGTGVINSKYSLFDATTTAAQAAGANNQVADVATFFVDRVRRDYRPSAGSPARGKAEGGLGVTVDLDGRPRPASNADVGAFQAP